MAALIPHESNYSYHHCVGGNDYYDHSYNRSCVFYNVCHRRDERDVLYYYVDPNQPKFPVMEDRSSYVYTWSGQEIQLGVYTRFSFNWSPKTLFEPKPDFPYDAAERAYFFHSFAESNPGHFLDIPHSMYVQALLHGYEYTKDTRLIDSVKNVPHEKNREQLLSAISSPKPMRISDMGDVCFKTLFAGAGNLAALESTHLEALTAEKFRNAVLKGLGFDPSTYPAIRKHKIVVIQKNPASANQFNRFHDHDKLIAFLEEHFEGIAEVVNLVPDHYTWKQQIEIVLTATVVLSTAGGGSYLAMFAREGATIVISDRNFGTGSKRDPATIGMDDNWWTQFHSITSMHYTVCIPDECDGDIFVILPRMFLTLQIAMTTAEKFNVTNDIPNHLRIDTLWRQAAARGAPLPPSDVCAMTWTTNTEALPDLKAELKIIKESPGFVDASSSGTDNSDSSGGGFEDKKSAAVKQNKSRKGWHAYNSTLVAQQQQQPTELGSEQTDVKSNCPSYVNATRPYSKEFVDKLSLWHDVASAFDNQYGETLYGSQEALDTIYKHQNPEDCSQAQYLVSGGWPYGFGTRIHQEGVLLALAMQLGRIYLPHPDGDHIYWETHVPFCRAKNEFGRPYDDPSLGCFYAAASKCTIRDAVQGTGGDVNSLSTHELSDFADVFDSEDAQQKQINNLNGVRAFVVQPNAAGVHGNADLPFHTAFIPFSLRSNVECSPMRSDAYLYWWRAVASTFLLRPNDMSVKALHKYRAQVGVPDYQKCVSMYVPRSSSDYGEGKSVKLDAYHETADMMWLKGLVPGAPPALMDNLSTSSSSSSNSFTGGTLKGFLFLGTEDPQIVSETDAWGKASGWDVWYTTLVNWNAVKTAKPKSGAFDLTYINILVNLEISLKCEAWVCSLAGSFCRIIDELRCTVGAKCNRYYADVSEETCSSPPCIEESAHIYHFGN